MASAGLLASEAAAMALFGALLGLARALLAASILASCTLPIHGQDISILLDPSNPIEEGETIRLTPQVPPEPFRDCRWLRGMELIMSHEAGQPLFVTGEAYSGREVMEHGCSLYISDATEDASGTYTVIVDGDGASSARGDVDLLVAAKLSKAVLQPEKSIVEENGEVTLNCITSGSSVFTISWVKDGEPVPETEMLSNQSQKLVLRNVTRDTAGRYTCVATNPFSDVVSNPGEIIVTDSPYWGGALWESGDIVKIAAGTLSGFLAICIGLMMLFFCLRCRRRRRGTPPPVLAPSGPPSAPPPSYENVCPFGPTGPWASPESSPENIYETLKYRVGSMHEEAKQEPMDPQRAALP